MSNFCLRGSCKSMKMTNSVILSEAKNLIQSIDYETLHFVQGDIFRTFARAS
jgi:hypothetical protein